MKRLIVLRHGAAEPRAASGADADRALTPRGQGDAEAVGQSLALAGLIPDVALVSPALRTRQTLQAMSPHLPDVQVRTVDGLFNAPAETLQEAAEAAEADTVLVVAHNPGVHTLALSLAKACAAIGVDDRAFLAQGFPTATAAAFEFAGGRTACLGVFRPQGSPD